MLKKIDWYILRQMVTTFVFCMLLFTVIAVAVDSSEKTDDFVKSGLSSGQIIKQYYLGFVPYIWGLLFPLFVFIATIFFTSKMAGRSEIIAILATGTTYQRWLRTYIVGGLFFAVVLWFSARYVLPRANGLRGEFSARYLDSNDPSKNKLNGSSAIYQKADSISYMGLKYFDTSSKQGTGFFLNRLRGDTLVYNLRSESIKWDTAKRSWKLLNVVERRVDPRRETVTRHTEMPVNFAFTPADLRQDHYLKDKLTTPELKRHIALEKVLGNEGINTFLVEQYRRSATPFSVVLLTLVGAIIAGRKTRGGSGVHLAIGIVIAVTFLLFERFSMVFSTKGNLPPLVAAWIPNAVLAVVAYYFYRRAPK